MAKCKQYELIDLIDFLRAFRQNEERNAFRRPSVKVARFEAEASGSREQNIQNRAHISIFSDHRQDFAAESIRDERVEGLSERRMTGDERARFGVQYFTEDRPVDDGCVHAAVFVTEFELEH